MRTATGFFNALWADSTRCTITWSVQPVNSKTDNAKEPKFHGQESSSSDARAWLSAYFGAITCASNFCPQPPTLSQAHTTYINPDQ